MQLNKYFVSVINKSWHIHLEKCYPSFNLNVKLKSLHVLNLEVLVRSDEKVLWEWVFPGTTFWGHSQQLTCLLLPHLAWVNLLVKLQILFVKYFVTLLLCQLLFLTSRFVFRFFLSLYLNIYLVACCIVCRLLRMLDKCSSARFQRKQPQYSLTHFW